MKVVNAQATLLGADDGALSTAVLETISEGWRASYSVTVETWEDEQGEQTFIQSDTKVFVTEAEALAWLDAESARRGFARYPLVRAKDKSH